MRRFTSWIFFGITAVFAGVVIWRFADKKSDGTFLMASVDEAADQQAAPALTPEPTSSVEVPTTTAMELTDPASSTLPGTLVVDGSSTAMSADGNWSASMEMIKEYPITYSFNDGNGPSLIVDDAYLLITNLKTGAQKEIGVLDLAPDTMIATAKTAATSAQFEYVTYDLAWTAGDQVTGLAELYDVANAATPRLVQSAHFAVNPTTWTVSDK
jgi:hypothetical protein